MGRAGEQVAIWAINFLEIFRICTGNAKTAAVKQSKRKNTKMLLHAMVHADTYKPESKYERDGKQQTSKEKRILTLLDLDRPPVVHLLEIIVPLSDALTGDVKQGASLGGQTVDVRITGIQTKDYGEVGIVGTVERIVGQMVEKPSVSATPPNSPAAPSKA